MSTTNPKPRFRVIAGRPVQITERESPVEAARRRHGKPFAYEPGAKFEWRSGPSVLTEWLFKRKTQGDQ